MKLNFMSIYFYHIIKLKKSLKKLLNPIESMIQVARDRDRSNLSLFQYFFLKKNCCLEVFLS